MPRSIENYVFTALIVCVAGGCAKERTLEQIEADQSSLQTLYLTEKTNKQVLATANKGLFVDEATGEICYQPYECTRPDCPGKTAGNPVLFVHRDVFVSLGPDKKFIYELPPAGVPYDEAVRARGGQPGPTCPHCLKTRQLNSETPEQKAEFQKWIRAYELPETIQRRKELQEEHTRAFEALKKRRQGG